jgi:large subunit ribosomal protein L17e
VHFKNTRETVQAVRGMKLTRALAYLQNVLDHKEIVPFTRFSGKVGRKAQCKAFKHPQGRWPKKSVEYVTSLLENAKANAESKGLNVESLIISHAQANRAPNMRRRTFRAHGRINPYQSSPSHIEFVLTEADETVAKADAAGARFVVVLVFSFFILSQQCWTYLVVSLAAPRRRSPRTRVVDVLN